MLHWLRLGLIVLSRRSGSTPRMPKVHHLNTAATEGIPTGARHRPSVHHSLPQCVAGHQCQCPPTFAFTIINAKAKPGCPPSLASMTQYLGSLTRAEMSGSRVSFVLSPTTGWILNCLKTSAHGRAVRERLLPSLYLVQTGLDQHHTGSAITTRKPRHQMHTDRPLASRPSTTSRFASSSPRLRATPHIRANAIMVN